MKRVTIFALMSALLILAGCHSSKQALPGMPVIINNSDSVRTVYIETVTIDTVRVEVPIPMESSKQVIFDSVSHLETSLALSDAWINPNGTLGHSIANKPGNLDADVIVPHIDTSNQKESIKEREIPVPTPYPVEVERKWTLMEQIKLGSFWYLITALALSIGFIFRNAIWRLIKKLI